MEISPSDAVDAIKSLTRALERLGRISNLTLILLGLMLLASTIFFVIGVRMHGTQNEALKVLIERSR